ncbi:MFS transporter [Salinisphaera sp. Q1T1-3]|uniref:MFS transporter n=1 Tax=Salinisphaera sp. Q1T1-3 TaxID=2321229 RepID=UPI000E71F450|nr:MFS transporter [Salinisphaera sp. Q1T1-3]RJS93697.1 MFS transporter [Salinisphaera sp. Q1T1-3]
MASGQFRLLGERRFAPFFLTQFLGAFNDNLFKNALVILIAFQGSSWAMAQGGMSTNVLVNVAAGLFILPFFLFSATAGQIADKYDKATLMRWIKVLEIVIMAGAAVAFALHSLMLLFVLLFLMGTQSTLFGPVKYGYLPAHLGTRELTGGNGLVELGTFLAILLGTIVGGQLVHVIGDRVIIIGLSVLVFAGLGWLASLWIPRTAPSAPGLKLNWNPVTETVRIVGYARENRTIFLSIMGISWFWAVGALYLAQLPNYVRVDLGGDETVVTLLLALFSLGIGIGSMLCDRLSGGRIELGLVPFGAAGLVVFSLHLGFAGVAAPSQPAGLAAFLALDGSWRVLADLGLIGLFGGFYIVPLYALIQERAPRERLSRIIAANSVINALFMVLASLYAVGALALGLTIPGLFLATAVMTAAVVVFIFTLVPEFTMRFIIWLLVSTIYRVRKRGLDNIPDDGGVLLVCNHVSFMDGLILGGSVRRPARFVMYHTIFNIPVLSFIFRTGKAIPIAPGKEDPECLQAAYDAIARELADGQVVCLFPEGAITHDGELQTFREGVERVIRRTPVPVVPMALRGMWGSFFSRKGGAAMHHWPKRFRSRIELVAGAPVDPADVSAADLQQRVHAMLDDGKPV